MFFKNTRREILHINNVLQELECFVNTDPGANYDLIVGTDSQRHKAMIKYATVIFLWNLNSRKFRLFFNRELVNEKSKDIVYRLVSETAKSLEIAHILEESRVVEIIGRNCLTIHIDAGYNGRSRKAIPACTGIASGFNHKIKPDAWVASWVADRYSK